MPWDIEVTKQGQLVFKPTGSVPCVLHGNGFKGILQILRPLLNASTRWVAQPMRPEKEFLLQIPHAAWRKFYNAHVGNLRSRAGPS